MARTNLVQRTIAQFERTFRLSLSRFALLRAVYSRRNLCLKSYETNDRRTG